GEKSRKPRQYWGYTGCLIFQQPVKADGSGY
ncbi:MAG: hypothetical protein RL513_1909, partial [Pseudomonadota bacterium]